MTCVLCATRGRTTRLETGHVCPTCTQHLTDHLTAIANLCAMATTEPTQGSGGSRPVPASRPPINVEGLDPELTLVNLTDTTHRPTVLDIVEAWCRHIREDRGLAPYGVATEHLEGGTHLALAEALRFLHAQIEWATSTPDFPVDDFATEISACVRALRKWDHDAPGRGMSVPCPTIRSNGDDCGTRLAFGDGSDEVTCRRCHVTRTAQQLIAVAACDTERDVWVDPEAAAKWCGISERELRRWAQRGTVRRSHGRYLLADIQTAAHK